MKWGDDVCSVPMVYLADRCDVDISGVEWHFPKTLCFKLRCRKRKRHLAILNFLSLRRDFSDTQTPTQTTAYFCAK